MFETQEKTQGTWKILGRKIETKYIMHNIKAYCNEAENTAKIMAEIYFYNAMATAEDAGHLLADLLAENEDRIIEATDKGHSYIDGLWLKRYDVIVCDKF